MTPTNCKRLAAIKEESPQTRNTPVPAPAITEVLKRQGAQTFHSLGYRNFRLQWMGIVGASTGQWMEQVAVSWLVLQMTDSAFLVGAVSGARAVPFLLFSLWGGVLADRLDRRLLLMVTQAVSLILAVTMAALNFTHTIQLWHVFLLVFLLGVGWAFNNPARQAIVPSLVKSDDLMNAIALNSMGFNATRVIGPVVAGLLIAVIDVGGIFVVTSVVYMLVILSTYLFRLPPPDKAAAQNSAMNNLVEGLRFVRSNGIVLGLVLMAFAPIIFAMPYASILPVFSTRVLHLGPAGLGLLYAVVGVGAFASTLVLASIGNLQHRGRLLFASGLVSGVSLVAVGLSGHTLAASVALGFVGASMMLYMTTNNTMMQSIIPDRMRGRVMSVLMMEFGLTPLGALGAGALAEKAGAPLALVSMGGAIIVIMLAAVATLQKLRRA